MVYGRLAVCVCVVTFPLHFTEIFLWLVFTFETFLFTLVVVVKQQQQQHQQQVTKVGDTAIGAHKNKRTHLSN